MLQRITDSILKITLIVGLVCVFVFYAFCPVSSQLKEAKKTIVINQLKLEIAKLNTKIIEIENIKETKVDEKYTLSRFNLVEEKLNITNTEIEQFGNYLDQYFIPLYNANLERSNQAMQILYEHIYRTQEELIEYQKKPSYDYLRSVTVYISTIETTQKRRKKKVTGYTGTGVIIKLTEDYTYILTNNHIARESKDKKTIDIYIDESYIEKRKAEIVAKHPNLDLAIIKITGKLRDKQAIKGYAIARPQDKVFMVGHYLSIPYIYSEGAYAGYTSASSALMDMSGAPGNSGSGVFDKDGNLVAVLYAAFFVNKYQVDTAKVICVNGYQIQEFVAHVFGVEENNEKN